jgi:hypothetical protein
LNCSAILLQAWPPRGRQSVTGSLLIGEQSKHSGNYRQSNQNADNERNQRMSSGLQAFRSGALLRRSDA